MIDISFFWLGVIQIAMIVKGDMRYQVKQKSSRYNKSIYLLQGLECSCTHFQADQFFL